MLIPVGGAASQNLLLIHKDEEGLIDQDVIDHVRFVPLIRAPVKDEE